MEIVHCFWEKENLGKIVIEVLVSQKDKFDEEEILSIEKSCDYIVIKVPMNHPEFNFGLSKLGYTLVETQLGISKKYNSFDFEDKFIKRMMPYVTDSIVQNEKELEDVVSRITPDMFTTDRIALDKQFQFESSCNRYKNWIRTEFNSRKGIIKKMYYKNNCVGFALSREKDGAITALLGGIFNEYQSYGLGLLTSSFHFITANNNNKPFEKLVTSVSSNNVPVFEFYNYLGFKIYQMSYVYVKHI
jgi:ribosomal protein S18 acetylase RimI-like enzyme